MEYQGISKNNIIVRSNQLLRMKNNSYNLGSLKILDVYLSRINPLDSNNKTVQFTKKEYENLIGISKININDLIKYTNQLQSQTVVLPVEDGGYDSIILFERCKVYTNKRGVKVVELTCSETAKNIFFDLEGVRYIKYQLNSIINLKSTYSLFLYYYLLENEFRRKWTVDLDTLKRVLQISNELDTYQNYKFLNMKILKPAIKEINEKTNITAEYSSIREGRFVAAVEFVINKVEQVKLQSVNDNSENSKTEKDNNKKVEAIVNSVVSTFQKYCPELEKSTLTDKLKQLVIREYKNGTDFEALFITVSKSDFLSGRNGKWLGCDLTWCLENKDKILSGKYSNNGITQGRADSSKKSNASYDISELEKIE